MSGGHSVVRTRSGARAMRSLVAGEVMHPGVGPLVEARELYLRQSRLAERLRDPRTTRAVVVFDVGMGAASNAAAAFSESESAPADAARLELVSFEQDLGALELALTEEAAFGLEGPAGGCARVFLDPTLESPACHTRRSSWILHRGDLLSTLPQESRRADIVFWDPFSPQVNPALWTVAAFAIMRRAAGPRCTLFTYSASTAVRAAMLMAGWTVGVGDGIGSKEATTAAAARYEDLVRPLDRAWLRRLSLPDARLPAPPTPAASPRPSTSPSGALDQEWTPEQWRAEVIRRVTAAPQFAITAPGPGGTSPARGWR